MAEQSWAKQATDRFFEARTTPTQEQCDQTARFITRASTVLPVNIPGSLSYTVVCTGRQSQRKDIIMSFREAGSGLNSYITKQAQEIHGALVPDVKYRGMMRGAEPPLGMYSMSYLPGIPCLDVLSYVSQIDSEDKPRHICYIKHLANYFSRCWSRPQQVAAEEQVASQVGIHRRLANLRESSSAVFPSEALLELEESLPSLFSQDYPQVLTHGDLSRTNILVDQHTYEITGIVDWSLATVLPFGMELDSLYLFTGCMSRSGWHDYACYVELRKGFWEEFWATSGIEDDSGYREKIRSMAESAAKIGAILRYAFQRNADGSASEVVLAPNKVPEYLRTWFSNSST